MQPAERLGDEIDASLFEDDDGTVYFLWHSGKIARMKPDMSGLAEPYRWLKTTTLRSEPEAPFRPVRGHLRQGLVRPCRLRRHVPVQGQRPLLPLLFGAISMAATVAPSPLRRTCSAPTANATRRFPTPATTPSSRTTGPVVVHLLRQRRHRALAGAARRAAHPLRR